MSCEENERKLSWLNLRYYTGICMGGNEKKIRKTSVSPSPDRDVKSETPEYEAGVLSTRPRGLVNKLTYK
jgi:hypothetical protein